MIRYRCPYCGVSIAHRAELAGDRVACSKCGGEYFEPTDPLPGRLPEKAPPAIASSESIPSREPTMSGILVRGSTNMGMTQTTPVEMVNEMGRRGFHAMMIHWPIGQPQQAALTYSENLSREAADKLLLDIALEQLRTRCPDIFQLAVRRLGS